MSNQVRILSFPIFRRHWLYHAWQDPQAATAAKAVKNWRDGVNLEERTQLLSEKLQLWVRLLCRRTLHACKILFCICWVVVGLGEAAKAMEKHGACKGGVNQELHVQVLHCIDDVF